jgi:hypothetical protein
MAMTGPALVVLDPTAERESDRRPLAARLQRDSSARIALLDIHKPRGDVFLDALEQLLTERGHQVQRTAKPTFTKPAPVDLRREIAEHCDAVIEALAD